MGFLFILVYTVMIASALGVIGFVLVQHGKGADMGTGFGAGTSGSLFGATGSASFLSRTTAVLATIFFVCTLVLAHIATNRPKSGGVGVMEGVKIEAPKAGSGVPADGAPASAAPVVPAAPAKSSDVPK